MTTPSPLPAQAVQQDETEIRRIVQLYADGYGSGETTMFEEAFHNEAWIFYTRADGTPGAERLRPRSFEVWASFPTSATRILKITQAGDVANVMLICDIASEGSWLDVLNLLKIDGTWSITNKTATHISRAGDAISAP